MRDFFEGEIALAKALLSRRPLFFFFSSERESEETTLFFFRPWALERFEITKTMMT